MVSLVPLTPDTCFWYLLKFTVQFNYDLSGQEACVCVSVVVSLVDGVDVDGVWLSLDESMIVSADSVIDGTELDFLARLSAIVSSIVLLSCLFSSLTTNKVNVYA